MSFSDYALQCKLGALRQKDIKELMRSAQRLARSVVPGGDRS